MGQQPAISGEPRFSVVIPAYNEEAYLPRLLDTLDRARARYLGGPDGVEIIVADNASSDATAQLATNRGCQVVTVAERGIGAARNGGARAARGAILAFIDADTQVHPETFNEIDSQYATGRIIGGTTGIRFERSSAGIAVTYAVLVFLGVAIRGVRSRTDFAVDTGVVFCGRRDFEEIGGYREQHLFGEDVWFLLDMRKLGRGRGQRLARGLAAKAVFSTRKFDEFGDWHYLTMLIRLPLSVLFGRRKWIRRYWYDGR